MHPSRSRSRLLHRSTALAIVAAALISCSGDDAAEPTPDETGSLSTRAARLCSDIANDIDHERAAAGRSASLDVALAAVQGDVIDDASAQEYATAMRGYIDVLREVRDQLDAFEPGAEHASAWQEIVGSVTPRMEWLERRVELVTSDALGRDSVELAGGDPDHVRFDGALRELGLGGRDCEVLWSTVGNPANHEHFLDAAASACTTIVSRRSDNGFTVDLTLGAVKAAVENAPIEVTPALIAETETILAEWQHTADDLRAVPTDDVPDAMEWDATLAAVDERVAIFADRLAALQAADIEALARAYDSRELFEYPGFGDFQALGLDGRDCRSMQA